MKGEKKTVCLQVIREMENVIDLDIESLSSLLHMTTEELIEQDVPCTMLSEDLAYDMIGMIYEMNKELQGIKQTLRGCCCTLYDQVVR
ncbi:MAG: hypothetical protein IJ744_00195 [Lachnospiraceae bacterium]|nr:hypothetical protein [Lachnospiraceae bacterium]